MTEGGEGHDWRGSVRIIALNAKLRAECVGVKDDLRRRAAPASDEQILESLIRHSPAYGVQMKSREEWTALYVQQISALAHLPLEAIEEAFLRWERGEMFPDQPARHGFFPHSAFLAILAKPRHMELQMAAYRARKAIEHVESLPRPEPTPEEAAARKQALVDAGMMTPDGKVILPPAKGIPPVAGRSRETPQDMAARLRAEAETPSHDDGF